MSQDDILLRRRLHDLAEESRPPLGLARGAVLRARRRRRLQAAAAAAAAAAVVVGVGGLATFDLGGPESVPGRSPNGVVTLAPVPPQPATEASATQVVGRMRQATAVVWRGAEASGVDAVGRETLLVRFDGPTSAGTDAVLSPDGTMLAIPGAALGDYRDVGLWVLDLATGRARMLPAGGDQLMSAFWSPDSRSVLTQRYGGGQVYVVQVRSGAVRALRGFTGDVAGWGPDGRILAAEDVPSADGSGDRRVWLWLDSAAGRREHLIGLDGWPGLGTADQGGLPDPSATPDPSSTDPPPALSGWGTAGLPSPGGTLLPFERPTWDGRTELTVVDLRTGRQLRTWRLPQSDRSGQWTAWQDDDTLLAAEQPPGAALTVQRLTVSTGARSEWRSFAGATAITVAGPLVR